MKQPWRKAAAVGIALAASNLLVSSLLRLGDAEALYYCYGRHPQLSYLDHPPLIGWLLALSVEMGGPHILAVRVVPMLMTSLALLFTFLLTRDLFGPRAGVWAALLLSGTPVFSAGMIAAAPDAPLAALWSCVTWQLHRAALDERSGIWSDLGRPLLIGVLIGAAFLAKYTGACLVVTAVFLLLSSKERRRLRRPGFWLGAVSALAVASPVFIWNICNDWIGVYHRLIWTQQGAGFSLRNAGALIGGQLLYVGPFMLPLLAWGAYAVWRSRYRYPGRMVLLAASVPALFFSYLLVLWSDVAEPHWPAVGYMPLFPAAAGLIASGAKSRALTRIARLAVGYGIAVLLALHLAVLTPILPAVLPTDLYNPKYDLSNELRGWPEAADAIRALDKNRRPVLAAFYTQCSQLSFALSKPDDPIVRCISKEIDDFDIWYGEFSLRKEGALFVTDNRFNHDFKSFLPDATQAGPVTTVDITRAGRLARRFYIYDLKPNK